MNFMHSRYWRIGRRVALLAIVLILGYRLYGDRVRDRFAGPDPTADIVIMRSEFRNDLGERPLWFIGLRNTSARVTYDQVTLEATYLDSGNAVIETDRIVINQRLEPGAFEEIGSPDPSVRTGAAAGRLTVIDARVAQ